MRSWTRPAAAAAPPGCDCGKPWVKLGGRHVCRYFGTFRCGCGHEWTSAYCWKGEKQNCRRCDAPRELTIQARRLRDAVFRPRQLQSCPVTRSNGAFRAGLDIARMRAKARIRAMSKPAQNRPLVRVAAVRDEVI